MMIDTWTRREKILIILLILAVVSCGMIYFATRESKQPPPVSTSFTPYQSSIKKEKKTSSMIVVDLKGEVNRPGIYRLPADARLYQAVKEAGGLTSQAEQKQLNLAQKLQDGIAIYIPRQGETVPAPITGSEMGESQKLNVNTATAAELEELDGLGPTRAKAIIQYREEHGPFQKVEDLQNISGIGDKTLAKFRDQIVCQ
jgi:competence protein ComEA